MIWFKKSATPRFVITPGKGVEGCEIGFDKKTARDVFGRSQKEGTKHIQFSKIGVDVYTDFFTKKILSFIFFFQSNEHRPFHGVTSDGISRESSIEDVVRIHGRPSRRGHSRTSDGFDEDSLEFNELGVWYTFYDGRLADIRVFAPEESDTDP